MSAHIHGLADMLANIGRVSQFDAERALMSVDPVLARLLRAEAIADHRADNHVCEAAKLPAIRDLLRLAIVAHTGKPFENPIFPEGRSA
jgi:hypothetical protein